MLSSSVDLVEDNEEQHKDIFKFQNPSYNLGLSSIQIHGEKNIKLVHYGLQSVNNLVQKSSSLCQTNNINCCSFLFFLK